MLTFPTMRQRHPQLFWVPTQFVVYVLLAFPYGVGRARADKLMPHDQAPILAIERWIGGGITPSERLQACMPRQFDIVFVAIYATFFFIPLAVLFYVGIRHWELFPSCGGVLLLTMYAGLLFFVFVPVDPPWLAVGVHRIVESYVPASVDANPSAAFPSLHVAVPAALMFWFQRYRLVAPARIMGALAIGIGFSVVYLGEHYVTDVVAGVLLAYVVSHSFIRLPQTTAPR